LFEPGREIIICNDTVDALAALDMPDSRRRSVAQASRQRVLAAHTGEHRARELENHISFVQMKGVVPHEPAEIGESVA
jgi:spore maturation protein CgeB